MTHLAERSCTPVDEHTPRLDGDQAAELLNDLAEGWIIVDDHRLERSFSFPNFVDALAFVNRIGEEAETLGHHPDIFLAWGKVRVMIWTHVVNGLTDNDFILAAKVETHY
ncbi:MAG: 4a-hydroxytetrahydrobiopterin dehydratase [Chlamydiia bacterium]|nr:4a-hydroxytetrahydrobiopterin dehydratase [Chlamydiia bacterium]